MLRANKRKLLISTILQFFLIVMLLEQLYFASLPNEQYFEWQNIIEKWDYVLFSVIGIMFYHLVKAKESKKELPTDIYLKKK